MGFKGNSIHPLYLCNDLAQLLADPKKIRELSEESVGNAEGPSSLWQSYSFADGFAGISYFYSALYSCFPDQKFNELAQLYIQEALEAFKQEGNVNSSLFKGLAGLGLAMSCISNPSENFKRFHLGIDDWLIENTHNSFLSFIPHFLQEEVLIPPFFYGYCSGLSGILVYCLQRDDNPYLQQLAFQCAQGIAKLMLCRKRADSMEVLGWYFTQNELMDVYKNPDIQGGYNTSIFYGITGCLIALATAIEKAMRSDEIYQAIEKIATWLITTYEVILKENAWNHSISFDGKINSIPSQYQSLKNSWLFGWPPVAKALFLAGKTLKNNGWLNFSLKICNHFFDNSRAEFFLENTSFSLGRAGFIATLYPLAKEMKVSSILQQLSQHQTSLIKSFDPHAPFGFTQKGINMNESVFLINSATLASGAAGIALTLLMGEDKFNFPF